MRFAYADPPYLGCCKLYDHHHPDGRCWDEPETHRLLIERLSDEYPDGWAMSLHAPSLRVILPMTPEDCRTAAWCKTWHQIFVNNPVQYAWEPVIFRGGRPIKRRNPMVRDWIACSRPVVQDVPGQKSERFSWWIFDLLGMEPGDEFVDMFTGSGAVTRAWETWKMHTGLFAEVQP